MKEPGFLRCSVTVEEHGNVYRGAGTAAFDPEAIRPADQERDTTTRGKPLPEPASEFRRGPGAAVDLERNDMIARRDRREHAPGFLGNGPRDVATGSTARHWNLDQFEAQLRFDRPRKTL